MQRDPDLIRALMLILEQATQPVSRNQQVSGYTSDEVAYHLALIVKGGYAEGPEPR